MAREMAAMARSCPTTRRRRMFSMSISFSASSLCNAATGTPVQEAITSSMSSGVTSSTALSSVSWESFSTSSRSSISRSRW